MYAVIAFFLKRAPNSGVSGWLGLVDVGGAAFVITVGNVLYGQV